MDMDYYESRSYDMHNSLCPTCEYKYRCAKDPNKCHSYKRWTRMPDIDADEDEYNGDY